MHELKELVDHSFQELPVGSEEAWILANDVHDVGGYDGLVVLSSLLLTQTQQILKHTEHSSTSDTNSLFCICYHVHHLRDQNINTLKSISISPTQLVTRATRF